MIFSRLIASADAQRGTPRARPPANRPSVVILHTTGSGVDLEAARRTYRTGEAYPHYLIGHDGQIYGFAGEDYKAAHAAWRPWESAAFADGTWRSKWARDYADDVVPAAAGFYDWWDRRWPGLASPVELLEAAAGAGATPNRASVGIELLDCKPEFTDEQYTACARLCLDVAIRWAIPIPSAIPAPQLLSHSDINPGRRSTARGPWDPTPTQLRWERLAAAIQTESDLTRWRFWT